MKLVTTLTVFLVLFSGIATARDPAQRTAFHRKNSCPSTGRFFGACPGFVVDHIYPLCAGGADAPFNMQWQEYNEALIKDNWERKLCRGMKK